jgi:hypothetical protein
MGKLTQGPDRDLIAPRGQLLCELDARQKLFTLLAVGHLIWSPCRVDAEVYINAVELVVSNKAMQLSRTYLQFGKGNNARLSCGGYCSTHAANHGADGFIDPHVGTPECPPD